MRLAKYLAQSGVAARRAAEVMIKEGRVTVNGLIELRPQTLVTDEDVITVDGERIRQQEVKLYFLLNKPSGYLSTVRDTHNRATVLDLLKDKQDRLYPVGRLDLNTSGVLLLTNDGELAHRLTHPRYGIKKIYRAGIKGIPGKKALDQLLNGVEIDGDRCIPDDVILLKTDQEKMHSQLQITLTEGRKRQVRKILAAINHPVYNLERISFAGLTADSLSKGAYRSLSEIEVKRLYSLVNL
ncbi:MAG: rRNA pseudouridine synthase [Firmicutes bacterium]|nr:rRNA pseudouridine synthase [Bacillota bacterium]